VVRDNDLISIPKEIGELTKLKELCIQNNRLTVLPPELGEYLYKLLNAMRIIQFEDTEEKKQ